MGCRGGFSRTDRRNQHPERTVRGACRWLARLDPGPEFLTHRRQPVPRGSKFPLPLHLVRAMANMPIIAAASVLAKTHRDEYMMRLAEESSPIRLGEKQGLPDARTPLPAIRERPHAPSPADVQPQLISWNSLSWNSPLSPDVSGACGVRAFPVKQKSRLASLPFSKSPDQ